MADNLQITEGSSSKYVRSIEKTATIHTSLTALDIGSGTTETRLVAGQAASSASIPVTLANDQANIVSLADNLSNPTVTIATAAFLLLRDQAGSNWDRAPGDSTAGMWAQLRASTTGGATATKLISAASTNATSVKASAGTLYMVSAINLNAAARYLKFYNKASAPTVGTDTPVLTFAIPGNTAGAGFIISVPQGIEFTTGIAFALTTAAADADTGAVAASEIIVNLAYK